jgi:hypothetical protein
MSRKETARHIVAAGIEALSPIVGTAANTAANVAKDTGGKALQLIRYKLQRGEMTPIDLFERVASEIDSYKNGSMVFAPLVPFEDTPFATYVMPDNTEIVFETHHVQVGALCNSSHFVASRRVVSSKGTKVSGEPTSNIETATSHGRLLLVNSQFAGFEGIMAGYPSALRQLAAVAVDLELYKASPQPKG